MDADLRGLIDAVKESRDALQAFANDGMPPNYIRHMEAEAALDAALEAAELSAAQGQGWLPIESAPKSTALLLYCGWCYELGHLNEALGEWVRNLEHAPIKPTHWQPLPAAPAQPDGVE